MKGSGCCVINRFKGDKLDLVVGKFSEDFSSLKRPISPKAFNNALYEDSWCFKNAYNISVITIYFDKPEMIKHNDP